MHFHAGEELIDVGEDQVLDEHEPVALGQSDVAAEHVGHLQAGEAPVVVDRVAQDDAEAHRQVRDVRERVPGIDGQRREHREDPIFELPGEVLLVAPRELVPREDLDPLGRELAQQAVVDLGDALELTVDLVADRQQRAGGRQTIGRARAATRGDLVLQAGDAHLEELVEIATPDPQEPQTLQQRGALVARLRQDALVEGQPRQLAVEVVVGIAGVGVSHATTVGSSPLHRQVHRPHLSLRARWVHRRP